MRASSQGGIASTMRSISFELPVIAQSRASMYWTNRVKWAQYEDDKAGACFILVCGLRAGKVSNQATLATQAEEYSGL